MPKPAPTRTVPLRRFAIALAACGVGFLATSGASLLLGARLNASPLFSIPLILEGLLFGVFSVIMLRVAKKSAAVEALYRDLIESSRQGIWHQDRDAVITWANARIAEILAVPPDELPGRKAEEFFFPSDHAMERTRAESVSTAMTQQFDRRLRRSDGAELWVLTCCSATEDGCVAMMTDITERKRAESALRLSESRYRRLFEGVSDGVYQSTPDGQFLTASPALLRMLGVPRDTGLQHINLSKITSDVALDPAVRRIFLEKLERESGARSVEYQIRNGDGATIWVLESARVIRDEHGAAVCHEGSFTEITEQKQTEAHLREARKVEALGRLSAGIAQDFNTSLNLITTQLQAALAQIPADHDARSATEYALIAARNAAALTDQLLSFSRRPADPLDANRAKDAPGFEVQSGESILLVENDPLVRELSRDMLERQGYQVVLASEAKEAEAIGAASHFDLLITSTQMPSMTGEELARRIRIAHPGLRVLFVSGYDDPPRDELYPAPPGADFLQKPFSADALGRSIRRILSST